jgi:outer membrane protein OmpA-like peptidoglycan-associated protein
MKAILIVFLACVANAALHAQTAAPLDAAAAAKALSAAPEHPRFITKGIPSPIVSRKYAHSKGVDVEIVEHADGNKEEFNFVNVPVLFVVDTDRLLDRVSQENVQKIADIMKDEIAKTPTAKFQVEGHTSSEGAATHNQSLSVVRADRVFRILTQDYQVPASALISEGLGASQAQFPANAPEAQRQADRRVLVARTR